MTARPIRRNAQTPDRNGKIFYTSTTSLSHISKYAELVCDLLEIIPYNIVMHRLSADSPAKILIAPKWAYRKRLVLNTINQKLKERDSWQGKFSER